MPQLPLPEGEIDISGGDLPVTDTSDVLAEFPRPIRNAESAPVRDAFADAWAAGFVEYQNVAGYAAAQSDPMRATGNYLLSFADERSIVPRRGETEEELRDRLFKAPEIVTPQTIIDGINEILAPVTDKTCRLLELNLDGLFIHNGEPDAVWNSFIEAAPDYPDRYYADDEAYASNAAIPSQGLPRSFHILIPRFSTTEDDFAFIPAAATEAGPFSLSTNLPGAMFVFSGVDDDGPNTRNSILAAIVAFVDRIKGQGISWSLVVDDTL